MSKKRKTRKQKEGAHARHLGQQHVDQPVHLHTHIETPTYSVTNIATAKIVTSETKVIKTETNSTVAQKDAAYLRHDITSITAASGIVAAVDILLFVALNSGFVHLHFLGY